MPLLYIKKVEILGKLLFSGECYAPMPINVKRMNQLFFLKVKSDVWMLCLHLSKSATRNHCTEKWKQH